MASSVEVEHQLFKAAMSPTQLPSTPSVTMTTLQHLMLLDRQANTVQSMWMISRKTLFSQSLALSFPWRLPTVNYPHPQASTENISIRELVNHGTLWLCLILRLRNTLTYLLTSHGPQSDDLSEAEASTPVKGGWGRGSHGHGRGGGLERDRVKLSDVTVSSRAARVSTDQCRGKGWGKRSQRRSHIIDETVLEDRSVTSLLNWHFN